jgi:kojibiose phosphorylase
VQSCSVVAHERTLDLRHGLLHRWTVFEDGEGRRTRLETLRFASFTDRHLCALRVDMTPENHDLLITFESGIDGRRRNLDRLPAYPAGAAFRPEVKWEKWAHSKHLEEAAKAHDYNATFLEIHPHRR